MKFPFMILQQKTEAITSNDARDYMPMWSGNKIYYVSDRDSRLNIFCYDVETKQTKRLRTLLIMM